ncbi:MAG: biopolymer transporter ExbD [candidate division Zixibacteria bacterium]|nr:biopolymer transporter ExbD [candidate division Zixibacteria bacterium]
MKIKGKRRVSIRIDMTPMVDIAFLLLIFYMATTTFKPPETKAVTLPKSYSQIKLPDKDIINITVTKLDSVFVDYLQSVVMIIEGQEITTLVRKYAETDPSRVDYYINLARLKNPLALVVIKADENASYGAMQTVMETMQKNNLRRFQLVTDPKTPEGS